MAGIVVVVGGLAALKFLGGGDGPAAKRFPGVAAKEMAPNDAATLGPALDVPSGAAAGYNVLLITLDTTRADHVGCYGATGGQTPFIDSLAAGGTRFADAVTVVPMTLPAHASILTGNYPPTHGVRDNGTYRLPPETKTLATELKSAGYSTAAFIGAFVLDRRYGLSRGFDVYDDLILAGPKAGPDRLNPQRRGDLVADSALRWLDEQRPAGQPFLAWVHFFDPHLPYDPPEPFKSRFAGQPYDGEIAFMDQQIGRVIDKVRALGLLEKTLVVIVGDHGEGLGDHGESSHSLLIYAESMNVPLLFHAPGLIPAGKVVADRVVAVVDLMPTILDLLGLPITECDGVSLRLASNSDRAVYMETLAPQLNHGWSPLFGLRRYWDKYIEAPQPEYYDLQTDWREMTNRWGEDSRGTMLAERLAALKSALDSGASGAATLELDTAARRKLESLGYIGSSPGTTAEGPLPDPKYMIAQSDQQMQRVSALLASGRATEAIPQIRQLLSIMPGDASVWSLLAVAHAQAGQLDEAIESRLRLLDLQPSDAQNWVALATLQYAKGDVAGFEVSLAEAERLEPELGSIYMVRARRAKQEGRLEEALALCEEALRRDPTRYALDSLSVQVELYRLLGRPAEAEAAGQRARQLGAP